MARVTVEDCILNVPNRFELVIMAAQRAKQIASGNPLTVDRDNDKDAVVALREIADKTVSVDSLQEDTVQYFSKRQNYDTLEAIEQQTAEINETFEEAKHHIESAPKAAVEDDDAGMTFEDDVDAED